ncbi:hypothetical protein CLD22_29295, partial [Rubrivivax gelatinosus]|nr:hypothetical protein [Rubrivivax gelatinosus]
MLIEVGRRELEWQQRPLCRRYRLICVEALTVPIHPSDGAKAVSAWWALGVLSDGELDLLGVWLEDERPEAFPARLIDDLRSRGVESVGHLARWSPGRPTAPAPADSSSRPASGPLT